MERIDSLNNTVCTGCTACVTCCPVGAISMQENEIGFLYPFITTALCISCGNCVKICQERSDTSNGFYEAKPIKMLAMKHKEQEIHRTSQSGGVFYALAKRTLAQGGSVFGAAFTEDLMVAHRRVDSEAELSQLQGSKYVQSDMGSTVKEIKCLLEEGKQVLFSGTPCQCAGVASACRECKDNLLLVDLVCHGVPSPKLWKDFLKSAEKKYKGKVTKAVFRIMDGSQNGHVEQVTVNEKNYQSVTYGQLFYSHAFFRTSCDYCRYRTFHRVGDVTLGDWIYGRKTKNAFWDKTGVSEVLVNTKKGEQCLNEIQDLFHTLPLSIEECAQPPLLGEYQCHPEKDNIQQLYREKGFRLIAEKYGHEDRTLKLKRRIRRIGKYIKRLI